MNNFYFLQLLESHLIDHQQDKEYDRGYCDAIQNIISKIHLPSARLNPLITFEEKTHRELLTLILNRYFSQNNDIEVMTANMETHEDKAISFRIVLKVDGLLQWMTGKTFGDDLSSIDCNDHEPKNKVKKEYVTGEEKTIRDQEIIQMSKQGHHYKDIALKFNLSIAAIFKILRKSKKQNT